MAFNALGHHDYQHCSRKESTAWDLEYIDKLERYFLLSNGVPKNSDERCIVNSSLKDIIKTWNSQTFDCLRIILENSDNENEALYSPDGSQFISISDKTNTRYGIR